MRLFAGQVAAHSWQVISATALAAARYVSYGEVQGLYIALPTSAGLTQETREPGLMEVNIEYTRLDRVSV